MEGLHDKQDALRYRWLRQQYGMGSETYLAEEIVSEQGLDEYIDGKLAPENPSKSEKLDACDYDGQESVDQQLRMEGAIDF